jgi:hypothetical protein
MSNGIELKIKQVKTDYMHDIYLGMRAYFIELSEFGYSDNITKIAAAASVFPFVVFNGDEPFKQMGAVVGLCKEIQKMNPYTKIILYTNGLIKPVGMTSIKNIDYIVKVKPKDINYELKERVDETVWKWLAKAEAKFVFEVNSEDDFDEINMLIAGLLIKKNLVFVNIKTDDFQNLAFIAHNNGLNLFIQYDGDWFNVLKEASFDNKDSETDESGTDSFENNDSDMEVFKKDDDMLKDKYEDDYLEDEDDKTN